jgi:hypothetical protein
VKGKHLLCLDPGPYGIQVVQPRFELGSLAGHVVVEHGLAQLGSLGVRELVELSPAAL